MLPDPAPGRIAGGSGSKKAISASSSCDDHHHFHRRKFDGGGVICAPSIARAEYPVKIPQTNQSVTKHDIQECPKQEGGITPPAPWRRMNGHTQDCHSCETVQKHPATVYRVWGRMFGIPDTRR